VFKHWHYLTYFCLLVIRMSSTDSLSQFVNLANAHLLDSSFVKMSLGNYKGNEPELKNLYIRKVSIKRKPMLSFNYRYRTRDIFKNFEIDEGLKLISALLSNDFRIGTLFTIDKEVIVEHQHTGSIKLRERILPNKLVSNPDHDKQKNRIIKPEGKPYLEALRVTDTEGKVYKNAQDKYKQINRYIEILSSLIKELPEGSIKKVADMGSGKGYLTFALYDYLTQKLNLDVDITGVEFRGDLVKLCNEIAQGSGFSKLNFVEGTIDGFSPDGIDLLIALHACDTATDDAIYKGIKAGADLIVVAPCCHKQIRREMEKNKVKNDISFLTKYGIFLERQAEMVTDGLRALILAYFGYKTKVFEFISDAHTPKNVLVIGIKEHGAKSKQQLVTDQQDILKKIKDTKAYFGIGYHHLERLMELE